LREQIRLFSELNQLEASILRKLIQKGKALPKAYTERRLQVLWKEIYWLLQKLQEEFRVEALGAYLGAYADTYFNPRPDNFVAALVRQRWLLEEVVIPWAQKEIADAGQVLHRLDEKIAAYGSPENSHTQAQQAACMRWRAAESDLAQYVTHTLGEVERDQPQGKPRNLSEILQLALYVRRLAIVADLLILQSEARQAVERFCLENTQVDAEQQSEYGFEGGTAGRSSVDDGASKRVVAEGGFGATFSFSSSSSRARAGSSTLSSREP
jgi:hypothetical protein